MTAPDKIWADPDHWIEFPPDDFDRGSEYTEYTRTATIPALLAEARAEGYTQGVQDADSEANRGERDGNGRNILALLDTPAPAQSRYSKDCVWCVDGLQADGETPCPCQNPPARS